MSTTFHRVFALLAAVVVVGAVVYGFAIVGSPEAAREERLDEQRLRDLQIIVAEIHRIVVARGNPPTLERELPATLEEAASLARQRRIPQRDPETGEPYGYRILDEQRFELCATFTTVRDLDRGVFWNHPAGRHCFEIDILDRP